MKIKCMIWNRFQSTNGQKHANISRISTNYCHLCEKTVKNLVFLVEHTLSGLPCMIWSIYHNTTLSCYLFHVKNETIWHWSKKRNRINLFKKVIHTSIALLFYRKWWTFLTCYYLNKTRTDTAVQWKLLAVYRR